MPAIGEIGKRRDLFKYIGVAAISAAVPTAFFLGRSSTSSPTGRSIPETPQPPQPTTEPIKTPEPKPTARPTVFIPELAIPTRIPPPTPRPTEKPATKEVPQGKVWEIPVRQDLKTPFLWTGEKLFVVGPDGVPAEINRQDKSQIWKWERKGVVVGSGESLLHLFNYEALRAYALDINTKEERWKFSLPGTLFANYPPGENTAALVSLRFQVTTNYIAFATSEGLAILDKNGQEKVIPRGELLQITDNKVIYKQPPANRPGSLYSHVWTTRAEKLFGDDSETWQDEDVGTHVADDKIIVYQKSVRAISGNAVPTTALIYAREIKNGNVLWQDKFNARATPLFLSKDLVVIQDPDYGTFGNSNYYLIQRKNFKFEPGGPNPTTPLLLPKELNTPYKFVSRDNWTFAVHPRSGTKAFKDGVLVWENDDILAITYPLGEIDGKLVLAQQESTKASGNPEGAIWLVDTKNGKKLSGFPVYFDTLMTEPKILGNKVVVADGIGGKRFSLKTLDLATRQTATLLSDLYVANLEKVNNNLFLAQARGLEQKLYLFRI